MPAAGHPDQPERERDRTHPHPSVPRSSPGAEAPRGWCDSTHPHDEHAEDRSHRSTGRSIEALCRYLDVTEVRMLERSGMSELEIGLVQPRASAIAWVCIEDGARQHLQLSVESARRLLRVLAETIELAGNGPHGRRA